MEASAFLSVRRVPRSDRTGRTARPCERDTPATKQLRQWLWREHKIRAGKSVRYPDEHLAGHGSHAPERADSQFCVGAGLVSNESPVRKNRTPSSMSLERNRGQGGDRGTGIVAKAADNT